MSRPNANDFHISLTFPAVSTLGRSCTGPERIQRTLEESLATSVPTSLDFWDRNGITEGKELGVSGVVIGCQDGDMYVLHRAFEVAFNPSRSTPAKELRRILTPSDSGNTGSIQSPTSHSILSPTFNVTAKPRVVSGITTDSVEAPKNYVDFEDEPDRLKDILKGINPKDRRPLSDSHSEKSSKPVSPSVTPAKRTVQTPRSLLSAANSRAPSPPSFSVPQSPHEVHLPDDPWTLLYHLVALPTNRGIPVRSIHLLSNNKFFVALHENGSINIHSTDDGACITFLRMDYEPHDGYAESDHTKSPDEWIWSSLSVLNNGTSIILAAIAEHRIHPSISIPDPDAQMYKNCARCAFIELIPEPSNVQLRIMAQLDLDGPTKSIAFHQDEGVWVLVYVNSDGHLIRREVKHSPSPSSWYKRNSPTSNAVSNQPSMAHLIIPNPFKAMMARSAEHLSPDEVEAQRQHEISNSPTTWLSEGLDIGFITDDIPLLGLSTWYDKDIHSLLGITWSDKTLMVFQYASQAQLRILHCMPVGSLKNAAWLNQSSFVVASERRLEIYCIKYVNADNEESHAGYNGTGIHVQPELHSFMDIGNHDVLTIGPRSAAYTNFTGGQKIVSSFCWEDIRHRDNLWHTKTPDETSETYLTAMLPMDLDLLFHGYSDGFLRQFSLEQMSRESDKALTKSSALKTSNQPLNGRVIGLHMIQNHRTREKYVVGGGDDGSIAFWSANTLELVSQWIIFSTPLATIVQFESEKTGPLRGCALCISKDGSIAVIVVDGLHLLYLIPGSVAPLARVCLGSNNLLLIYTDRRARLWDAQTKELWRSMAEDKAEEMLAQGGWSELILAKDACLPKLCWHSFGEGPHVKPDAVSSLDLNLEKFLLDAVAIIKSISSSRDEVHEILLTLNRLRLVLSTLLTSGLNSDVDSICYGKLGVHSSSASVGLSSPRFITLYAPRSCYDVWCVSSTVTASRILAIVAVLRAISLFEELTEGANTVIAFFTHSLAATIGPRFKPPSLEFLGNLWFSASSELRQSIRLIFEATVSSLSDEDAIKVAEKWQHHVPFLQPDSETEASNAALALFICGTIAAEKYSLLSISALTDISKSISLYLNDEKSIYRVLAVELCSRGFNVWQHYIDALEILRSLFNLATSVRKDSISIQNVSAQARLAVLNIAADNMPLFMGTICLDILTPPSMEHRRSVLQILAFLIRKRPHVLQPNLPRLMEAVVKSLDPNSTADRDLVLDTATEIIGYVVKTFPSVDFHMATQRLAVGTNEGAVVMYDLKTAIRLYVLEGHKKPITALSFSPDGRRLVTLSLKESVVLAWKVGSSFASFFNPGAPPRQGNGGSQSFKSLNFNIGDEANMSMAETIDLVSVEWVTDRSVKVKIRQSVLTFST